MEELKGLSSKLKKFNEKKFLCWQQEIRFWLIKLGLFSINLIGLEEKGKNSEIFVNTHTSANKTPSSDVSGKENVSNRNIICHGCFLTALFDYIHHIFYPTKTTFQ